MNLQKVRRQNLLHLCAYHVGVSLCSFYSPKELLLKLKKENLPSMSLSGPPLVLPIKFNITRLIQQAKKVGLICSFIGLTTQ